MFDKKKLLKMNKLTIGVILVFLLMLLVPFAYSKLFSTSNSISQIETAFFLLKSNYYTGTIKLTELEPRSEQYSYKFKIANNDGTSRLETKLEYTLKLVTTTNLPLTYKLYMNNNKENIIISDTTAKDEENGAYFRTLETDKMIFGYEQNEENIYELIIDFPEEYGSLEYQDTIEAIFVQIDAKQIIE